MSDARLAAFRVLNALEDGPRLESLLNRHAGRLPARERAFASSLVFTVLRNRLWLDNLLAAYLSRPPEKLDKPVLTVLRMGAAELALMSTPDHAAVSAAVNLAKATPARRGQGMVNAVLRKLAKGWQDVAALKQTDSPAEALALEYSHPAWLVQEMLSRWPQDTVRAWLAANQEQPPLTIRANTLKTSRGELAERLSDSVESAAPHAFAPEALVLTGAKVPAVELPGFADGLFQVQDAAAQAMGHLLDARSGMRVLDLCAGAGGKTGHLAALIGGGDGLVAVEPSPGRVKALKQNLKRLGVSGVKITQADGLALSGLEPFDRVLVDAPCSALGVLGRRPDVRWRRTPDDPPRLARLQLALAKKAASLVAPGGAMLYCTCTITEAENQQVVQALLAATPGLRLEWPGELSPALAACVGGDGYWQSLPQRDRADAFFAARLVRS